jgi:hypothetical protein
MGRTAVSLGIAVIVGSCGFVGLTTPTALSRSRLQAWGFGATNGAPYAGDARLLTTISPNGDGLRDAATLRFILAEAATVTLDVREARAPHRIVFSRTETQPAGPDVITWAPLSVAPGTYLVRLALVDAARNRRVYDALANPPGQSVRMPVVRVLGIEGSFTRDSAAPGSVAILRLATDASQLTVQIFQSGPERVPTFHDGVMHGVAVTRPVLVGWSAHPSRPATLRIRVGAWPSGVYYVRLAASDRRVGYAPLIIRPARLGQHRIAVVLPTNTWQAYNFRDDDGDGIANTWYENRCPGCRVRLHRPFLDRGEPPHYRRYDLPFLHWLAWRGRAADYLTDSDLERIASGALLARAYDLIVFPGHHEYVTRHEYDLVSRFRDLGGNLAFLSANNFFWRVDRHGDVLRRIAEWRDLGRPEAALIGVQYRANDRAERKGTFVVVSAAAAPWLFRETGLHDGSSFTGFGSADGRFGIEIDSTAPSSPPQIRVLAEIRNLYGLGLTAQMTYYETLSGARVFAAGAFTLGGAATWDPVTTLLDNLWNHLARP